MPGWIAGPCQNVQPVSYLACTGPVTCHLMLNNYSVPEIAYAGLHVDLQHAKYPNVVPKSFPTKRTQKAYLRMFLATSKQGAR